MSTIEDVRLRAHGERDGDVFGDNEAVQEHGAPHLHAPCVDKNRRELVHAVAQSSTMPRCSRAGRPARTSAHAQMQTAAPRVAWRADVRAWGAGAVGEAGGSKDRQERQMCAAKKAGYGVRRASARPRSSASGTGQSAAAMSARVRTGGADGQRCRERP